MSSSRSFRMVALVALGLAVPGALAGCKKDEPAQATPEPAASASSDKRAATRRPLAPIAKVDPPAMKEYRLDVCYFGTQTFAQARDAYLASLGGAEPSEKKLPLFAPEAKEDKPAAPAKPGASAAASAAASARAPLAAAGRRGFHASMRAPHERHARACSVAMQIKDAPMGEVDAALAEYAPFAVELSKNLMQAQRYYKSEEFKKDKFEKGKELHKKLVEGFKKLDELQSKLGTAMATWRKEHAPDAAKLEPGQKLAFAAYDDARDLLLLTTQKKVDPAAFKAAREKLEKSTEALRAHAATDKEDPWAKILPPSLDAFLRTVKDVEPKLTAPGPVPAAEYPALVSSFVAVTEAKHRALSRWLIAKGQTQEPRVSNDALRVPHMIPRGGRPGERRAPTAAPHGEDDGHGH